MQVPPAPGSPRAAGSPGVALRRSARGRDRAGRGGASGGGPAVAGAHRPKRRARPEAGVAALQPPSGGQPRQGCGGHPHQPRRQRRLQLLVELAQEQRQLQRLGHPGLGGAAVTGQPHHGLVQAFHRQRRPHLDPHHRRLGAGVGEPVVAAGLHRHLIAGAGNDGAAALAEPDGPGQHPEALLLHRVDVAAWHLAVGGQDQIEAQQLPAGVGGGLVEDEPLAADRVVEYLSCKGHGGGWRSSCQHAKDSAGREHHPNGATAEETSSARQRVVVSQWSTGGDGAGLRQQP
jgi:hypothetical protein